MGGGVEPGPDGVHAGPVADVRPVRSERGRHAGQHSLRAGGRGVAQSAHLRAAPQRGGVHPNRRAVRAVRPDPGRVRGGAAVILNEIVTGAVCADAGDDLSGVLRDVDSVAAAVAWGVYAEESASICVGDASGAEMSARTLQQLQELGR